MTIKQSFIDTIGQLDKEFASLKENGFLYEAVASDGGYDPNTGVTAPSKVNVVSFGFWKKSQAIKLFGSFITLNDKNLEGTISILTTNGLNLVGSSGKYQVAIGTNDKNNAGDFAYDVVSYDTKLDGALQELALRKAPKLRHIV